MEIALATLLVSSFTSVGVLAIWAAVSPWNWFLRAASFLSLLSLLLMIPAFEPFVAFVLQGATVATGIQLSRKQLHKRSPNHLRFSLVALLQAMAIISVLTAVAVKLPTLNLLAWQNVVLIGITAGLATLTSCWVVHGRKVSWPLRILSGFLLGVIVSLPLVFGDWFVMSINGWNGWPPERLGTIASFASLMGGNDYTRADAVVFWATTIVGVVALLGSLLWLLSGVYVIATEGSQKRVYCTIASLSLFTLVLTPSLGVYYKLMTPLPIPEQSPPANNGYHELISAGRVAEAGKFYAMTFDSDSASTKALRAAVTELAAAYEELHIGLSKKVRVPINYESPDGFGLPYVSAMRSLALSTSGRAQLAIREDRLEDALEDYLDTIRLGYAIRPETLMLNALVGIAITSIGQRGLYEQLSTLDAKQSTRAIAVLQQLESESEWADAFVYRDRIWSQHANGWHGHLVQVLSDVADHESGWAQDAFHEAFNRERAISHLLCAELAIHAFHISTGTLPTNLDELVPEYLPAVPSDPFDPAMSSIRYRHKEDRYILYSVGCDGKDDHGVLPTGYGAPNVWYSDEGDLLLSHFFAPDPPVAGAQEYLEDAE
ncbi:hypothetical protein ACFL2H_07395 [Planctomycetota bacterium]